LATSAKVPGAEVRHHLQSAKCGHFYFAEKRTFLKLATHFYLALTVSLYIGVNIIVLGKLFKVGRNHLDAQI
jgi:hypothetical protein